MKQNEHNRILKIVLLFVLLQPILDILSRGAILGYIPNISTYLKPIFVFGITGYLLLFHNPKKKKWLFFIVLYAILVLGHTYILYKLLVDRSIIIHEFRFMVNIAYMLSVYITFDILYYYSQDKEEMYRKIKKTILCTFILYFSLYLISIVTGTSGMSYEIADKNKLGFKGWYDSGQILGHAYSIMLPLIMYITLVPKRAWYKRAAIILLFLISVSLIGTKVPYYITLVVLILYLFITIFIKLFNKDHKPDYFNIVFIFIMIIGMSLTYKYTPVKYNTDLNNAAAGTSIEAYDLKKEAGYYDAIDEETLKEMYPDKDITSLVEYNNWSRESSNYLISLFETGKLHPSNMRIKQIRYATYKYHLSSIPYKLFGLGFLNQNGSLALESDFTMALFSFGIFGLILFLIIPVKEFVLTTFYILKNLKTVDLETYMIYMGLGIFFCISIYAGYTYIYTNFSIFLILLIIMLKIKRDALKKDKIKKDKITFLLLHLGYGGIETSTINTANALSNKYEIELVSFYKLEKNQANKISDKITVRYLYNGGPNRNEFKQSVKEHNIFRILKEGIKAADILIKKRLFIIREILNCNSKFIISTRYDFSTLLSKYGQSANVKIAQEHHYHNNNKKYINILKNKYHNIDYLFALTTTLEKDYREFLKNNHHTIIKLVPNMLYDIPNKTSSLNEKNLVTISRLDYGKKNDDIIKAFSKIKDKEWKLYIIGDGVEFNNLNKLINDLNLKERVILTGYKDKSAIESYLLKSSIFLMASLTEGLPMVLLEAMSYGIPCIAYETASGVNDIIKNNYNGYVIKNRNESEFIKSIDTLTANKLKRKEFGKNAKETVKLFSKEEILKIWSEVLRSENNAEKSKKEK